MSGAEGNANFHAVTVDAFVETDADEDTFGILITETETPLPVTQLFKRSGRDYSSTWTAVPLTAS